jgi:hypothetical protein
VSAKRVHRIVSEQEGVSLVGRPALVVAEAYRKIEPFPSSQTLGLSW